MEDKRTNEQEFIDPQRYDQDQLLAFAATKDYRRVVEAIKSAEDHQRLIGDIEALAASLRSKAADGGEFVYRKTGSGFLRYFIRETGHQSIALTEMLFTARRRSRTTVRDVNSAMGSLAKLSDWIPGSHLRKTLKKYVADEHAEVLALAKSRRGQVVAWRIWCARIIWIWYVIKGPASWLVRAVVKRWLPG